MAVIVILFCKPGVNKKEIRSKLFKKWENNWNKMDCVFQNLSYLIG